MYKQQYGLTPANQLICPECNGKRFRVSGPRVECTNCGWKATGGNNKYGAKRTEARDGTKRDSKYEASVADELLLRKQAKDIKDYDSQFKVEMWVYRKDGSKAFSVNHKVDFRIHHNDGSFELVEAKGAETWDWRWRRKLLEELWLPENPDHTYTVVKQNQRRRQ